MHGIQILAGNAVLLATLTNIEMTRVSLKPHNKPWHIFMCNVKVVQGSTTGLVLTMNFGLRKDVRGAFMTGNETLLSLVNIHTVNEKGQSSVDINRVDHHIVNMGNIGFRLPERSR